MGELSDTLVVIPARLASTRLPRKVLMDVGGKPLMQYAWENACDAVGDKNVVIASSDDEVLDRARIFGAIGQRTEPARNGTLRAYDAASRLGRSYDVIVNLQADEPEVPAQAIRDVAALARSLADNGGVATLVFDGDPADANPQQTKVVLGRDNRCLFFSRRPLPCCKMHAGVYGYGWRTLCNVADADADSGQSDIGRAESLEQLDWLWDGIPIYATRWSRPLLSVNTIDDLLTFEATLS